MQITLFGRKLAGQKAQLLGFEQTMARVADPEFSRTSGKSDHAILRPAGASASPIEGSAFEVTDEELARADAYEPEEYTRVEAKLASGGTAWVYVDAASP